MLIVKHLYLRLLEWLVIAAVFSILALIFINVVLRYAFNSGIFLAEGLAGLLFVWMTFIGAILVLYDRQHIGVDMLVRRFPTWLQRAAFVFSHLIMIYATWLLLTGSWSQALINLNVMSTATRLPMALLYFAGVAFSVASGLFLVSQLVLALAGRLSRGDLTVSASEDDGEAERILEELRHHQVSRQPKGSLS